MIQKPDAYILVKINIKENNKNYKVGSSLKLYSSWFGGCFGSDRWRLNSGIKKVEKTVKKNEEGIEYPIYTIYGYSSTIYEVGNNVGTSNWTFNNVQELFKKIPDFIDVKIIYEFDEVIKLMEELVKETESEKINV